MINAVIDAIQKEEHKPVHKGAYEKVLDMMKELNQTEIVKRMESANNTDKSNFLKQIEHLEKVWPGGIRGYIARAKVLLEDSKNGKNPLEEYTPSVPEGFNVKVGF